MIWPDLEKEILNKINAGKKYLTLDAGKWLDQTKWPVMNTGSIDNKRWKSFCDCIPQLKEIAINNNCSDLELTQNGELNVSWS